jgi:histidine ammonia-lyase
MVTGQRTVLIDGTRLNCSEVVEVARQSARVRLAADGLERARAAAQMVREIADSGDVYGRTTGVGANRDVTAVDPTGHGRRLLRSHAAGAGPALGAAETRAMMVVRLNQLAAGGSGVEPAVLEALAEALNSGKLPPIRRLGAIGTGDLHALASLGLRLLGEASWQDGTTSPPSLDPRDAAALMSSNAATLGEAALAFEDVRAQLQVSVVIAALALLAVGGDPRAYDPVVQRARPHPGQQLVAARMRELLAGQAVHPSRIQDPYGYRALPQAHGPALDAATQLERVLSVDMNSASENPLVDVAGRRVLHNGNFHSAYLAGALDSMSLALYRTATLGAARLSSLMDAGLTGLTPFLAGGPEGSSGLMILEYVAQSCLAELRRSATPATVATAVISRGVEDHAPFSTEAARSLAQGVAAYRVLLSCELVAATRAVRMRGLAATGPLGDALDMALAALDPRTEDRPLDADLDVAEGLLAGLAGV